MVEPLDLEKFRSRKAAERISAPLESPKGDLIIRYELAAFAPETCELVRREKIQDLLRAIDSAEATILKIPKNPNLWKAFRELKRLLEEEFQE